MGKVIEARRALREAEAAEMKEEMGKAKATVPEGYTIRVVESVYYGSHSEYGEDDGWAVVAVPEGAEIIKSFAHGHFSRSGWKEAAEKGCLEWDGEEWVEIDTSSYPNLYEDKPEIEQG